MAQPYVGEIRIFAGNFPPVGWMFCEGQQLAISENETLFQLIGTTYGGDGQETFNLPDLQGRVPIHQGNGFNLTDKAGVEEVTLTTQQIPIHTHPLLCSTSGGASNSPTNNDIAASATIKMYRETTPSVQLASTSIMPVGGSQPHSNFQPYLCVDFIISLFGIFPSQT